MTIRRLNLGDDDEKPKRSSGPRRLHLNFEPDPAPLHTWEGLPLCGEARDFGTWCGEYIERVERKPTPELLIVAWATISKKYKWKRNTLTADHYDRTAINGHACVYQVFMKALEELEGIEELLDPPMGIPVIPPRTRSSKSTGEPKERAKYISVFDKLAIGEEDV